VATGKMTEKGNVGVRNHPNVKNCADMEAHIAQVVTQIDASFGKDNAGTRLLRVTPRLLYTVLSPPLCLPRSSC
jgi:hypothetical protein